MEQDQSETLNNNVDWNVFMENVDFDKLIASSEFDKYFPTHAVETLTQKTTADKCIQTDPEDERPIFIDLTNAKKKRRHGERARHHKKHKTPKVDPNEIIFIDSDVSSDEESVTKEANTNDKNGSPNDTSGSGLASASSASVKKVRCIIKTIKPNEKDECSQQQTANPEQMVLIESDDEFQNTSDSNVCNIDGFEQRPAILNEGICQK